MFKRNGFIVVCSQETADSLEVERIGSQHQAGSDSLLTSATFFKVFLICQLSFSSSHLNLLICPVNLQIRT